MNMATTDIVSSLYEMTITQAADILGFSEQHVDELLDAGRIRCQESDEGRIVLRDSLLAYHQRIRKANATVDEMVRLSEEMGLYDD